MRFLRRLFYDVVLPIALSSLALALAALGILYLLRTYTLGSVTSDKVYEVARDLLVILLAAAGVIGAGIFAILRFLIRKDVEQEMDKRFSAAKGGLATGLGLMHFSRKNLRDAIAETRRALAELWLEPRDKLAAQNNLAYYYANVDRNSMKDTKRRSLTQPEREEALRLAEEIYRQYDRWKEYPYNNPDLVETYMYVKATFAQTKEERQETRQLILEALRREELKPIREVLAESLQFLGQENEGS